MPFGVRDERWMRLAFSLGSRNAGRTWPNPSVGCVIVKDNRVAGRGWTQAGGRPHAEALALKSSGIKALGATAYVTLEPCAHHGKTPPCAAQLAASGIARVVSAIEDPGPRVAGSGHSMLEQFGIAVETGCLSELAAHAHRGFFLRTTRNRPMVTLKLASSIDGRIAVQSGDSKWITGPDARRRVHLMRSHHDSVMVGRGTVSADDPQLTPRVLGLSRSPVRVFLDTHLASSVQSKLGRSAKDIPVWICHSSDVAQDAKRDWLDAGATLLACREDPLKGLDIVDVLGKLADRGITSVFCEGGSHLATSLLEVQVVDRVVNFMAGLALGKDALPSIQDLGLLAVGQAHRFELDYVEQVGNDAVAFWNNPGIS